MKSLMIIAALGTALFITACKIEVKPSEPKPVPTALETYYVKKIFTVENCDVYEFWAQSYYRYFSTCQGNISNVLRVGKTTRTDEISTSKK